ncbi:hypothetical protein [Methylomarinum vadi]|uniref:hypothetical protein n=1 Tax=Methylomarinum vadi TaxID=438855 RepID=UPI0004DED2C4|nr:hypothetical protein [Methylomarinum vadi]
MLEVAELFLVMIIVAATAFFPLGYSIFNETVNKEVPQIVRAEESIQQSKRSEIPEDSTLRRHFLTQLRAEVEAEFAPRPTDSTLKRHHDALIAAELEKRLEELA